jgi:hypothetical protein
MANFFEVSIQPTKAFPQKLVYFSRESCEVNDDGINVAIIGMVSTSI